MSGRYGGNMAMWFGVLWVFGGVSLLQSLAGGQWFIGRVLWVFCGVPLLLFPCRWSMVHRLGGVSLGEMWCGSSVGFYGCVGVAFLLQSLAGNKAVISRW